jgi:cobalt transporter subunit CbtA
MIGRVILAALLAGIAAGLIMGVLQHVRLTPYILEAEKYENAPMQAHDHGSAPAAGSESAAPAPAAAEEHDHDEGWQPADGWPRVLLGTYVSRAMAGAGFATVLAGIALLTGTPLNRNNGFVWGLCGFLAVTVATSAGLPPELPGMPAADLLPRQVWWVGTVAATGAGLWLLAIRRETWAQALAIVLIGLPHVIGAPQPLETDTAVPAYLISGFITNSIAANAVFWALIGVFLGIALDRYAKDLSAR